LIDNDLGGRITNLQFGIIISATAAIITLLIGCGAAQVTSTASTEIVGNIGDQIILTPPSNMGSWNLIPDTTNTVDRTLTLTTTYYWGVNVASDQYDGKMKEYSGNGYVADGKVLANPLHVACTGIGGVRGHSLHEVQLTGQDQPLIDAGGWDPVQSGTNCDITFSQIIDQTHGDARITTPGDRYHIVVTFTGFISY